MRNIALSNDLRFIFKVAVCFVTCTKKNDFNCIAYSKAIFCVSPVVEPANDI